MITHNKIETKKTFLCFNQLSIPTVRTFALFHSNLPRDIYPNQTNNIYGE